MSANEMIAKIRELKELQMMADELKAEITAIEDTIKATMTEQGVNEMTVDIFKVRWTPVTSVRFDSTGFKKAMPELYERFARTTESRRFSIS